MADGVVLVAHGTVASLDEIPSFLARIRRGRAASDALVEETKRRYRLIGGSPLLRITEGQAAALREAMGVPVTVGMRLSTPTIQDALGALVEQGVQRVCVLPLAPFSVPVYHSATVRAAEEAGLAGRIHLCSVPPWGTEPELIEAHAHNIEATIAGRSSTVILTAHSLPLAVLRAGDPYADQVRACADAIAARLGRPAELAYQSQGAQGEGQWLGPELRDVLGAAARAGARVVTVAPVGFLADHVETLYDLDVEAATWARELGIEMLRVPALNTTPGLIRGLAAVARRAFASAA